MIKWHNESNFAYYKSHKFVTFEDKYLETLNLSGSVHLLTVISGV